MCPVQGLFNDGNDILDVFAGSKVRHDSAPFGMERGLGRDGIGENGGFCAIPIYDRRRRFVAGCFYREYFHSALTLASTRKNGKKKAPVLCWYFLHQSSCYRIAFRTAIRITAPTSATTKLVRLKPFTPPIPK